MEFVNLLGFPGDSAGKESASMQETWVRSLGWEDPLEKGTVFWPGEFHKLYSPWGGKESDMTEQLSLSLCQFITTGTLNNTLIYHGYLCRLLL